ncbi:MAG: 6-phospho-3-hexuloisomerase [Methanosarcinales archaeon]|nr:6-phospho-3-hexuloisomerase [Methanosarcinales archaeon]
MPHAIFKEKIEEIEQTASKCKHVLLSMNLIADHLAMVASSLDEDDVDTLISSIINANSVFLMGAGRSGLVAKAFAMRLMHLGISVYVVGETTTPAVNSNDVVIAISGSGETKNIANLGSIVSEIGATLITLTTNANSRLGSMSNSVVVIKGRSKIDSGGYYERHIRGDYYDELVPMGTTFEVSAMAFLDACISELMMRINKSEGDMKQRHATLE